jgi:hypothetical protein
MGRCSRLLLNPRRGITNDGSLRTDGSALYWADGEKVLRMPFETAASKFT